MSEETSPDPRLVGYREFDARVRPLELQLARLEASLADIPRRQTAVEQQMSEMRAAVTESVTLLREIKAERAASAANADSPLAEMANAFHRFMDEQNRAADAKEQPGTLHMQEIASRAWDVAKILALVVVVLIGGKQTLAVLG